MVTLHGVLSLITLFTLSVNARSPLHVGRRGVQLSLATQDSEQKGPKLTGGKLDFSSPTKLILQNANTTSTD
jgi:hypothetical protein